MPQSTDSHSNKKIGVTSAIRDRLKFNDERLWKRFSARRLELIDTLDLSSKKASEQEDDINKVAEALRLEFNYPPEYFEDFDRLVRAAVQSVRRNRKRSSKTKVARKRQKLSSVSPEFHQGDDDSATELDHAKSESYYPDFDHHGNKKFISEISRLNSDTDEIAEYSRTRHFSEYDRSREAIQTMIQPRSNTTGASKDSFGPVLPSIQKLDLNSMPSPQNSVARGMFLNLIERSKTCSEAASSSSRNLEFLGKGIVSASIGYVFEKSFTGTNEKSLDYLRTKLSSTHYLANFYRDLDPARNSSVADESAVLSLYTLIGGCVKDFGVERLMMPICEMIYLSTIKQYPLISQTSVPFFASDYGQSEVPKKTNSLLQLNSLATVASDIRKRDVSESSPSSRSFTESPAIAKDIKGKDKKAVSLRFLTSTLNFTFPTNISATPKLDELLENARSAFHLSKYNDSQVLGLKNMKDGFIIKSDRDLERIFTTENSIELEVFTQKSHAVPIYEITSMVVPNRYKDDPQKIILPPPVNRIPSRIGGESIPLPSNNFKFLSNSEEPAPPPLLPRFQPLL